MAMIIRYAKGDAFLYRLNPLSKLCALVACSISIFLIDAIVFDACALVAIVSIDYTIGSKKLGSFMSSKFVATLALSILCMQVLFTPSGNVLLAIPLHWFRLIVTDLGILKGILMALRFLAVVLMGALFVATTDPTALVYSLMKAGVPYRFGFMIIMMLRFVPMFETEANTVSNAQKMRGLELDKGGVRKLLLSVRYTFLPLIVSALSKVDTLVISMEARAFGYRHTRTFLTAETYSLADRVLLAVSIAFLLLMLAGALMGWLPLHRLMVS
jgi:energy-coupling factor transport system permease protein